MGAQTGLRATGSQDHTQPSPSGCVCSVKGRRAAFNECLCEWGTLMRQLMYLGYDAPAEVAVQELHTKGGELNALASRRRREILQDRAASWTGTRAAFAREYGIGGGTPRLADLGIEFPMLTRP